VTLADIEGDGPDGKTIYASIAYTRPSRAHIELLGKAIKSKPVPLAAMDCYALQLGRPPEAERRRKRSSRG
jgi:hypothetical protein